MNIEIRVGDSLLSISFSDNCQDVPAGTRPGADVSLTIIAKLAGKAIGFPPFRTGLALRSRFGSARSPSMSDAAADGGCVGALGRAFDFAAWIATRDRASISVAIAVADGAGTPGITGARRLRRPSLPPPLPAPCSFSSNSSARVSIIVPPSCSASTMVTAGGSRVTSWPMPTASSSIGVASLHPVDDLAQVFLQIVAGVDRERRNRPPARRR